jgi:valyl-tRNA synthetase
MDLGLSMIRSIRSLRKQVQLKNSVLCDVYIAGDCVDQLAPYHRFFKQLAGVSNVYSGSCPGPHIPAVVSGCTLGIPITESIDITGHQTRLEQQTKQTKQALDQVNKKLTNTGFLNQAPEQVVADIQTKQHQLQCDYDQLMIQLKALSHNV